MILSLDKNIPMSLLLLSRVATLPAGHSVTYEDLRRAVAHLPDSLVYKFCSSFNLRDISTLNIKNMFYIPVLKILELNLFRLEKLRSPLLLKVVRRLTTDLVLKLSEHRKK